MISTSVEIKYLITKINTEKVKEIVPIEYFQIISMNILKLDIYYLLLYEHKVLIVNS